MFSGCFTSFDTTWALTPSTDKRFSKEVEDELKELARKAIKDKTLLIWLYWPYADSSQGRDIKNVLDDFVKTELKSDRGFRQFVRLGVAPTCVVHEDRAQVVILHIKGRQVDLIEAQG